MQTHRGWEENHGSLPQKIIPLTTAPSALSHPPHATSVSSWKVPMTCSVRRRKTPTFIHASALCSRNQQEDFVDSLFHPGMSLKTVRKRNSPQRRILNPTFGFPVHLDQESLRMPVF